MDVAATDYHSNDNAAIDYLAALEGASQDEQKQLFRLVLTAHGARKHKKHKCPSEKSIKPEEWGLIAYRLGNVVKGWSRAALRNNASAEDTANTLWDDLTLLEGKDRVVALGMLFDTSVVPYAQLPGNLPLVKSQDAYDEAHDRILDKIALFHRVVYAERSSTLEASIAIVNILNEIEDQAEQVVFVAHALSKISQKFEQAGADGGLLSLLGGAMPHSFRMGPDHDPDESEMDD